MEKTILIVDDFEVNLFAVGHTLKRAGYIVIKAQSGEDALKHINSDIKFDLVITDYKMPKMDGVELIRQIRLLPNYKYIPILILTTETSDDKKKLANEVGITGWIQKPFEINKFLAIVQKAIR